jgi:hypothetical protein
MPDEGSGHRHYLVSKEVVLGQGCIIEKCAEWNSLDSSSSESPGGK